MFAGFLKDAKDVVYDWVLPSKGPEILLNLFLGRVPVPRLDETWKCLRVLVV